MAKRPLLVFTVDFNIAFCMYKGGKNAGVACVFRNVAITSFLPFLTETAWRNSAFLSEGKGKVLTVVEADCGSQVVYRGVCKAEQVAGITDSEGTDIIAYGTT
jgi:hypothetical protein